MDSLLISILCIAVIVIGALVALVVLLLKPKKNQTQISTENIRRPRKDWKGWIPFVAIALVLAFWSVLISLFFLIVVWIMRLDPKPYQREIPYPSDLAREEAKGIYIWLLLSPLLTVPTMLVAALFLDFNSSFNQRVLAALIPLVFHLPLLFKLNTKNIFTYRHTQQAVLLIALRAGMASIALSIGSSPWEGLWLFFLGNGALWLFGSFWGRSQAIHKDCWWMKRKGETILPPETQTVEEPVIAAEPQQPITPIIKKNRPAVEQSLHAFRAGTSEERKQAVLALSQLGEVEKF
jgi:hypothetical protein